MMEKVIPLVFITSVLILPGAVISTSDSLDSDFFDAPDIPLKIVHAFGKGDSFTSRGILSIRNMRGTKYVFHQNELLESDIQKLKDLAKNGGQYFVQASVKGSHGEKILKSFCYAKQMLDSGLSDMFRLHISPSGEIISVSYAQTRTSPDISFSTKKPRAFNTTVAFHFGEYGPIPDTAPYLEKLEREKLAKERGEDPRDNRSFLAKYWMYIVPVALLILLSGASNPEGEGAGGGGGGR